MVSVILEFFVILLLTVVNGLFAMSELALVSARRARLAAMERRKVRGAKIARELADDPQRFLPTVQVGVTLVGVLSGTFGGARIAHQLTPLIAPLPYIGPFADGASLALVVLIITYLTLVFGELLPKQLALLAPEKIAIAAAGPIIVMARIVAPMVWLLGKSSSLVLRIFGIAKFSPQAVTEEELRALLVEGEAAGVLETEERDMIERLLRLADKPVRAIMTPRNELAWLDRTDPEREIIAALKEAPHSRFVVCDGAIDNVVGVVQAKDLLDRVLEGKTLSLAISLRQPQIMPDTVTALDALERLKTDVLGLALVMDEYGSFEGVVTAADVLAAIVGDHADAGMANVSEDGETSDGEVFLDGATAVDALKQRLNLPDLPAEGSYHTVAGLLLALLRRVPVAGDRIVFGGWLFEVTAMEGRRVSKVRASRETLAQG